MEAQERFSTGVSDQCVLIAGQPRSGTSLLTSMLRTSDDLLQAFELHIRKPSFIRGNDGRYTRNILRDTGLPYDEFDRILGEVENFIPQMNLGAWTGPKEPVSAEALSGNETDQFSDELKARARLVAMLMTRAASIEGKSRWGFKILGDVIHAKEYAMAFPQAQVVLLVRDPRDHALSVMKLNEQRRLRGQQLFYNSFQDVAAGWLKTIRDGRRALEAAGLAYVAIRYEDLVFDATGELKALENFLGIDLGRAERFYKEEFIDSHTRRFKHHDNLRNPINSASVGKWRSEMSAEEVDVFFEVAGSEMARWGYD